VLQEKKDKYKFMLLLYAEKICLNVLSGGSVATGRVSQAEQVKGLVPDQMKHTQVLRR
jgi:hypothetical protein